MNSDLPIISYRDAICSLVKNNKISIITGEAGCGKTSKIPQFLVDDRHISTKLHTKHLKLGITQPRRVAAISIAKRVSYERNCRLSTEVGYSIRFEDMTSPKTRIKYLTDGVLLRETLQDPLLSKYHIIMIDEAHERSVNTDILLGLLKCVFHSREDFRLVITSATLNTESFSNYFSKCPVLSMEGRQFPVEILYSTSNPSRRVEYAVNAVIRIHLHEGPGDVLVFLTGAEECELAQSLCYEKLVKLLDRGRPVPSMLILSLYGAMNTEDQNKVFKPAPAGSRKVVFTTNIAETSITLNGIKFVIDSGYVKQKQFNPKTELDALVVVPVSKEQADQRAGRAGRTEPGKCFRMFSDDFYSFHLKDTAVPEIKRVNLASTLLTLKALGIHRVMEFDYLDAPDYEGMLMALKNLYLIGALNEEGFLNETGSELAKVPLSPAFSRTLLASELIGCKHEVLNVRDI